MNEDRRREIGLFRYALIRDAADPGLSKAERGRLVRALCEREHVGPDGRLVRVARGTLDRWVRDVPPGRVRGARSPAAGGRAAHTGRDARAGVPAQARAAGADRGAGQGDHARRRRARSGAADVADASRA